MSNQSVTAGVALADVMAHCACAGPGLPAGLVARARRICEN
ncbi:hypothetical protein ACFYSJ_02905 [Streptomyces sp. NPDC005248]